MISGDDAPPLNKCGKKPKKIFFLMNKSSFTLNNKKIFFPFHNRRKENIE